MTSIDESFLALPIADLAAVALQRATDLGAAHADVRVHRKRVGRRMLRDLELDRAGDDSVLGLAVRVVHGGAWGFASGITLTADAAAALAEQAVATARVAAALTPRPVELAPEPMHTGDWAAPSEIDPFTVDETERLGRLRDLSERLLAHPSVTHTRTMLVYVQETTAYVDTTGTDVRQQRGRIYPAFEAVSVTADGFSSMRTLAPPTGRGWEYLTGTAWDFDAEIAELGDHLAAHVAAPSVEPGPTDLVIAPTNLWLTIHESVAHATELDRALGYEAAYAGTSFATVDKLGSLQYGSAAMNVTGDRTTEHGMATVAWDDEGVAAQRFDIVRDGVLVGYQLNRQMAAERGLGRSNGCAYADSPGHIPLQRMPNVSLEPAPDGPGLAELISRVDDGILVEGDKSWSIDMQRYNFQFTGQRFHRIRNGRLAGQVRDVAYQATTTDFWGSMEAVGGPQTYLLAGAINCGKGQPGQEAAVSHGSPAALFRGINILNTVAEGGQ
ncbi:TldD/PmbA family protein [Propionicicella superfundia]|uniref:TldD/PmbA family protein n=1 Tax=Propionicicella superfundia TaxID=348582 RepID=UPI0004046C2C|nr:TldD/PmbA family protein [Propionicicella superfundia]